MLSLLKNILSRLCWQINILTVVELIILASFYPLMKYANAQWFVEDGLVENIQLLICIGCFLIAWTAPRDKNLFCFLAMILILLICREVNTGRHWLCAYYDLPYNSDWNEIPYGYALKWGRNLFALATLIYFLAQKVYKPLWKYAQKAPLYVWDFLFLAAGIILALLAEKPFDNEIMEEIAETLFYVALFNLIWRYAHDTKVLN